MVTFTPELGPAGPQEQAVQEFQLELLKRYIALVDSPFRLQRLCTALYRRGGYDRIFHEQTLDDMILELIC